MSTNAYKRIIISVFFDMTCVFEPKDTELKMTRVSLKYFWDMSRSYNI